MLMLKMYRPRWTQCDDNTLHDRLDLVMVSQTSNMKNLVFLRTLVNLTKILTCSTKELSIAMNTILHAVKGGLLSYCNRVYSRGNIDQKHRIGGVMVSVLASSAVDRGLDPLSGQTNIAEKLLNWH